MKETARDIVEGSRNPDRGKSTPTNISRGARRAPFLMQLGVCGKGEKPFDRGGKVYGRTRENLVGRDEKLSKD